MTKYICCNILTWPLDGGTHSNILTWPPDGSIHNTLGGGRSTLANQGTLHVIEATPPGYYRAHTKRGGQKL